MNQTEADYQRIAEAIAFMRQNYHFQPDLATIAKQIHLSEYHFQRLFSRWAGISPKRFLQNLTVEKAKTKITQAKNLLDLSLNIGLSGSGRLHELFVKLEAMSPGEFKAQGAGLKIEYGIHQTLFGKSLIAITSRGICNLEFFEQLNQAMAYEFLFQQWSKAEIIYNQEATQELNQQIFHSFSLNSPKPLTVLVKGTNFQIQVWRALLKIPFGEITTYKNIAEIIGNLKAARAVGNAVSKNPISYLIPCHRVIRENGDFASYRWGINRKMALLGWEASQINSHNF